MGPEPTVRLFWRRSIRKGEEWEGGRAGHRRTRQKMAVTVLARGSTRKTRSAYGSTVRPFLQPELCAAPGTDAGKRALSPHFGGRGGLSSARRPDARYALRPRAQTSVAS